ncbi:hypothetical protein L226DRAFT_563618 [Lentinus tigrinus ALCF2SS1-7]|uniref:Uncharacterized protein n=1 Tax=Lentinus tigrinus ALCF2SS1-6 TaxID=1328759 RepID=A0A5C2S2W5_9APHY|nr:hypothetical protein L227DRAFT_602193 [Lentinus tigrinus ALCF2SS1-6]RPD69044.1 hypothetical protein L226DRAFT_563618 [Lentinus tigrinus ALCF2SS1-7]
MAAFDSIWNIALGVLSICMAIQGIFRFINNRLPSNRLHSMSGLLQDANELLLSCSEEGLVPSDAADDFRQKLSLLRSRADEVRLETLAAKNRKEDFANWLKGLTRDINQICQDVREIRAEISTSSIRERERLAAQIREREAAAHEDRPADSGAVGDLGSVTVSRDPGSAEVAQQPPVLVATPLTRSLPPSTPEMQNVSSIPASATRALPPGIPSITTKVPTIKQPPKLLHRDRRCSVSSNSSGSVVSSLHSIRWKCKSNPISRARAMATFLRYTRARGSPSLPVYFVDPKQLAACELTEDDSESSDDDWVDELAVPAMA